MLWGSEAGAVPWHFITTTVSLPTEFFQQGWPNKLVQTYCMYTYCTINKTQGPEGAAHMAPHLLKGFLTKAPSLNWSDAITRHPLPAINTHSVLPADLIWKHFAWGQPIKPESPRPPRPAALMALTYISHHLSWHLLGDGVEALLSGLTKSKKPFWVLSPVEPCRALAADPVVYT